MPPDSGNAASVISAAASVILLQGVGAQVRVLMGQRAAGAAFMPSKFVFPGGRVDSEDHGADVPDLLAPACLAALHAHPIGAPTPPRALTAAALRELREETGLYLAAPRPATLRFVFRAITPPGRTRRFDARFFLARAQDFGGDQLGFSAASGELAHLQWLDLPQARTLDLPFITRVILAEIEAGISSTTWPETGLQSGLESGVPFFDNSGPRPAFLRL